MINNKTIKETLIDLSNIVSLDIQQFEDNTWSTFFMNKKAYVYAPDKVLEFNRIQQEYMSSITEFESEEIENNPSLVRMIPVWLSYSNMLTNISTEIIELCNKK